MAKNGKICYPKNRKPSREVPCISDMSKTTTSAPRYIAGAKKSQRVSIPAHCYAYVSSASGLVPVELEELIKKAEDRGVEMGIEEENRRWQLQRQTTKSPQTPEEAAHAILAIVRNHASPQVNTMMAIVLREISAGKSERVQVLTDQVDILFKELGKAKENAEGFTKIRHGGFEALNTS